MFLENLPWLLEAAGGGRSSASESAAVILARGTFHCIASASPDQFTARLENNPLWEGRFEPLFIPEASPDEAIEVLRGLKPIYEGRRHVRISEEAIAAATQLSHRYLPEEEHLVFQKAA